MNVERWTPMYFFPYMDFSTQTPYFSATAWSSSARRVKSSDCLSANFLIARHGVGRDADHPGAGGLVVACAIAHAAGLGGAAGRVGAGIEVEDGRLALEVGEGDVVAVLVGEGEVGGGGAFVGHRARDIIGACGLDFSRWSTA